MSFTRNARRKPAPSICTSKIRSLFAKTESQSRALLSKRARFLTNRFVRNFLTAALHRASIREEAPDEGLRHVSFRVISRTL